MLADDPREPGRAWEHCMESVAWVGRWKFLDGWTEVWSSERQPMSCRGLGDSASG